MKKLELEFKLKNGQEFHSKRQSYKEEAEHNYFEENSKTQI